MNSHLSNTQIRKRINSAIKWQNRTHYLKWPLRNHWSLRYFFTFDTNSEYNGKWVLKNHKSKKYIIVSTAEAIAYIKHFSSLIDPIEVWSRKEANYYRRTVIHPTRGTSCYVETGDTPIED